LAGNKLRIARVFLLVVAMGIVQLNIHNGGAMYAQSESEQRTELRLAFLKHLPKRMEAISRRGRRFCFDGWDVNGLSLLHEDVQRLAGAAGRYGALEASESLLALEVLLDEVIASDALPDAHANSHLLEQFDTLEHHSSDVAHVQPGLFADTPQTPHGTRVERPPEAYWRRWSADAPIPEEVRATASAAIPQQLPISMPTAVTATHVATPKRELLKDRPAKPAAGAVASVALQSRPSRRIYHLTDGSEFAMALDQRLEQTGYELELLDSADELKEILNALSPDLVIVDPTFQDELEGIGAVLRATRERAGTRLPLLVLSQEDTIPARLTARRAGADAMLVIQSSVEPVLAKLEELLVAAGEATYRVLIVEDDRSQALFAESILRNAGMEVRSVYEAFDVIETMETFQPDLVLMDLYMPHCDGTELTALIREREEFLHTPIVFLSGESDQDKHFEALSAGGDDFLSKPIRPKHLIAAVNNRVRRARAVQERQQLRDPRDPVTGLHRRSYLLDRLNEALAADGARDRAGGLVFIEVEGVSALRDRIGLTALEQILSDTGKLLVAELQEQAFATRYGDGCYAVFCPERDDLELEKLAARLRNVLVAHPFRAEGKPLRLRVSAGVCGFRHGFADAGAMLNAAERAARDARAIEKGVVRYAPAPRDVDVHYSVLLGLIRNALERDAFELLYQPIVAVQGGDEAQYQTLLRMRDDQGRLYSAAEIIPLAEGADLIVEVDRWVLTQAMRVIQQRRNAQRPVRLFVSQSAASLISAGQAEWIAQQLSSRQLSGDQLVIELTLEDVEPRIDVIAAFCHALVGARVQFCLSRFDGGRAAEKLLGLLPLSFLKIAPKYLAAAQTPALRDELRALVDRGHRGGLQVIGQRVEDAQAAATLWMSGIDYIQGNLVQQAARELEFDFHAAVL
jgi:diguanylate cyclase (GGDEF)-like protein